MFLGLYIGSPNKGAEFPPDTSFDTHRKMSTCDQLLQLSEQSNCDFFVFVLFSRFYACTDETEEGTGNGLVIIFVAPLCKHKFRKL